MIRKEIVIKNTSGIHARPSDEIAVLAQKFESNIVIFGEYTDEPYDAKSIMDVLLVAAGYGTKIIIIAEGPDEKEAIDALSYLIDNCLFIYDD